MPGNIWHILSHNTAGWKYQSMLLPQPFSHGRHHLRAGLWHTRGWGNHSGSGNLHSGKRQLKHTLGRDLSPSGCALPGLQGESSHPAGHRLQRSSGVAAASSGIISSSVIMAIRLKTPGWEAPGERRKTQKEGKNCMEIIISARRNQYWEVFFVCLRYRTAA